MPAPRNLIAGLKVALSICILTLSLNTFLFSQTSIDDVHVSTRTSFSAAVPSSASIQAVQGSMLHVIKSDVKLVLVPVSVTDGMARFVTGLRPDNFEVFEDKKPQTIQHFSAEDVPVSVGIILDVSGSMADKVERVREAVNQFCEAANPEDEFFMIEFSDSPRLASDFTNSEEVEKALLLAQPKGRTSLLDAIYMGLHKMKDAKYGKKALLVISDGGDNHSRYAEHEVKSIAKESDVMIFSIGTFDRYVSTMEELRGPTLLTELAEPTGGRAFILDNPNEMPAVAKRIGMELRTQYVLAYRPQGSPHDGKWRKIRVRLRLPRRFAFLEAHAKSGYYGTEEPGRAPEEARSELLTK